MIEHGLRIEIWNDRSQIHLSFGESECKIRPLFRGAMQVLKFCPNTGRACMLDVELHSNGCCCPYSNQECYTGSDNSPKNEWYVEGAWNRIGTTSPKEYFCSRKGFSKVTVDQEGAGNCRAYGEEEELHPQNFFIPVSANKILKVWVPNICLLIRI